MKTEIPRLYVGEQLVSDKSFLRRLPVALIAKERLRFDAIVTASDIVNQAFGSMRQFAIQAGANLDKFGNAGRAFMLSQCWTLVDQLHAIRQLIEPSGAGKAGPFSQALLDIAEPATLLRNKMDHLAKNLDNLSKLKGVRPPLFGSLSYFYSPDASPRGGNVITIMSGSLHGEDLMPCINPIGREIPLPAGLFTLSAFGHQLEFDLALASLRDWLETNEAKIEESLRHQIRSKFSSDDDYEKAMATLGGGLAFVLVMEFTEDENEIVVKQ